MKQKHKTLHNYNNIKTTKLAKNSGKKLAKSRNITRTSSRKANKQSKNQPKVHKNQSAKTKTNPKSKIKVIINWPEYNKSLARRGDFMYFLTEAIRSGAFFQPLPSHEKGHPKVYKDELILFMLTMREIFNQPLRQTVTAVRSLLLANGLHYDLPDYTTLCRRAQKLDVEIIPTNYCLYAGDGICYMLDSTGFKVRGAGEWIRRKWGNTEGRTFVESHIGINHEDRMILSVINTDCNVHDNTQLLPSLIEADHNLKRARVKQNLEVIIGDGAYDANENYHLAKKLGAQFIAPPPKNAIMHMHKDKDKNKFVDDDGYEARNSVVRKIKYGDGLESWKEEVGYHRRSLNENVMYRYKITFGERMRHRNKNSCRTEQLIRARILNIFTMFGLPKYEVVA